MSTPLTESLFSRITFAEVEFSYKIIKKKKKNEIVLDFFNNKLLRMSTFGAQKRISAK